VREVIQLAVPLAWLQELDVRGYEAQLVAEVLANLPKRYTVAVSYPLLVLRMQIYHRLVVRDDVRHDLELLIRRCQPLLARHVSLAGAALVAAGDRDEAMQAELRKLTRDPRIWERLGVSADTHEPVPQ
jgi:hypothetical protein